MPVLFLFFFLVFFFPGSQDSCFNVFLGLLRCNLFHILLTQLEPPHTEALCLYQAELKQGIRLICSLPQQCGVFLFF